MSKRTVVLMPGDGIGKNVLPEAVRVLDAVDFEADYVNADIGWEFWCKEGNPLPRKTLDLLEEHKIGLFGSITSKPKAEASRELAAKLQNKGYVYYSPIVGLRQHFDLDICMRPCKSFKGNPLNFIRKGKGGSIEEPDVDVVIFRQNTEGLYAGVEWTNPPDDVYDALNTHPKMQKFASIPKEDLAVSTRIFTRKYTERIVRAAFEHAKKFDFKSVTVCEKPNVIRETSGMMLDHLGETEKATWIRKAIAKVVEEGKVQTYDMMKLRGSQEVLDHGASSTTEMTDEIIKNIKSPKKNDQEVQNGQCKRP